MLRITWIFTVLFAALFCSAAGNLSNGEYISPCDEIITFRITHIDSRFNISEDEVLESLIEAANSWSDLIDKPIFQHSPQGEITVSLQFNEEVLLIQEAIELSSEISELKFRISVLKQEKERSSHSYMHKLSLFNREKREFNKTLDEFYGWLNSHYISSSNQSNMKKYIKKNRGIEDKYEELIQEEARLNYERNELQLKVDQINEVIAKNNKLIHRYSEIRDSLKNYVKGNFVNEFGNKKITIYFFRDREELKSVFAHELGHAMGLNHVEKSNSIMFREARVDMRSKLQFSEEDKEKMIRLCE